MLWINFLHLYQPANIDRAKLAEATEKSYERILRALEEHPEIKFTLNIAGCLLVRWDEELKRTDLIKRLKILLSRGQIELTGSAAYHALLPLVQTDEAKAQIIEQEQLLKKYFGAGFRPKGFFLPEMAYSPQVARLVKKLGYRWLVLDEISATGRLSKLDCSKRYLDAESGLEIIFRQRALSESYVPETILKILKSRTKRIAVTATDAELYGLRHIDQPANFEKLLKVPGLKTQTISEYLATLDGTADVRPVASNWQSSEAELKDREPFALWYNRTNKLQQKLWRLASLTQTLGQKYPKNKNRWWARWHLKRGLSSCTFWWASNRNFKKVFGPVSWNPDEIEKGANELIRSIRSLEASTDTKTKIGAEKLAAEIKKEVWLKHWQSRQ